MSDQPAAEQGPDHRGRPGDPADDAEHGRSFARRVEHLDAREHLRHHHRREASLDDPAEEQHLSGPGQARGK